MADHVLDTKLFDPESYSVERSVGLGLRKVLGSMSRAVDERMVRLDLTDRQWTPLILLAHCTCSTAAEMARALDVDSGAMTRLLDRLEAKGFLRRVRSCEDRRVVRLELTEQGARIAQMLPTVLSEVANAHLLGFTRAEVDTLLDMLARMWHNGQALERTASAVAPVQTREAI